MGKKAKQREVPSIYPKYLRRPKSLGAGSGASEKSPLYHVPMVKQALALNKEKTVVTHRTLKSFGKYLWKFRYFGKIHFFQRPKGGLSVCQTDKVSASTKYINV